MNPSQEPAAPGPPPAESGSPPTHPTRPTFDPALPSGLPYPPPPADAHGRYGWYADGAAWAGDDRTPRRPWRRTVRVCSFTVLSVAALGVPFGLLWAWLSPSVPVLETAQSGAVVNDSSPEQFVAADGWFTIVGFGFGVLVALAGWLLLRRDRGPALLLGVVLGSLAAAPIAWQVGRLPGLAGYQRWLDAATAGDTFSRPPDLHAYAALLVPGFAAVIACTLLAGWSNDPDLEVPGARPGHGANSADAPSADAPSADAPSADAPSADAPSAGAQSLGAYRVDGDNAGAGSIDAGQFSSGSPGEPGPTAAPAPPARGPAVPPHG